ncbi:MAG TPA: PspC domain-containing protein [Clostridia bacterium]|nr:PspC domain-containing protein [Clostridia bacterium]
MKNRLYRSESDKKIAGVCGGIAEYFGIDSTIIRLIWTISIAVYGTGLLVYIIAAIIMPTKGEIDAKMNMHQDSDEINKQKNSIFDGDFDKEKNKKFWGYLLIIIGAILLSKRFIVLEWLSFRFLFPIILIILGILVLSDNFRK